MKQLAILLTLLGIIATGQDTAQAQWPTETIQNSFEVGLDHDVDVAVAVLRLHQHIDYSDEFQDARLEGAVKRLTQALRQGELLPELVIVVMEWQGAGSVLESKTVFTQSILELDRLVFGLKEDAPGPELEP